MSKQVIAALITSVIACSDMACWRQGRPGAADSCTSADANGDSHHGEARPSVVVAVEADRDHQVVADHCHQILADSRLDVETLGLVSGCNGWILISSELDVIWRSPFWGQHATRSFPLETADRADPLVAIRSFASDLREHGVELLLAPVPTRPMVYPESIACDGLDLTLASRGAGWPYAAFLKEVELAGVDTVNLLDELRSSRTADSGGVFLRGESHWTGRGVVLAATRVAHEIRSLGWIEREEPSTRFVTRWIEREIAGDLVEMIDTNVAVTRPAPEMLGIREVLKSTSKGPAALEDRAPQSPVVLIGDSFVDYRKGDQASLRHQLSAELGFEVDALVVNGGGVNECRLSLLRESRSMPDYLKTKRVVVWCFGFRDAFRLWHRLPVVGQEHPRS